MRADDLRRLGDLLNESHRSLRDLYEVSSPELNEVVDIARSIPGIYGARMTGGGFGGSAIALLDPAAFEPLRDRLIERYYAPRGFAPAVFEVSAVWGASRIL